MVDSALGHYAAAVVRGADATRLALDRRAEHEMKLATKLLKSALGKL